MRSVRNGVWTQTDIAIETIDMLGVETKRILREVAAMRSVTHENIIYIMGLDFSTSQLQFHILMELVNSNDLHDDIFDEEVKGKFNLTLIDKHFICRQLIQAVFFLQTQPQKIVHRKLNLPMRW